MSSLSQEDLIIRNKKGQFIKGSASPNKGKPSKLRGKKRPPFSQTWKDNIGRSGKGRTPHNKGKKTPIEVKEKQRQAKLKNPTRYWLGKRRDCISQENHYNWKGGITKMVATIRHSYKYRLWRDDVFTRDDYTCQKCFKRGCYLEAHHIINFAEIIAKYNIRTIEQAFLCDELWSINNGLTLCVPCHNDTKRKPRK